MSPTEILSPPGELRHRRRKALLLAFLFLGLPALVVLWALLRFTSDRAVEQRDDLAHFKYGSTGGERLTGIPYWLWVALPELFPENLPDPSPGRGYASFGFLYEEGKDPRFDLPVGVSRRRYRGIDMVYVNCASCHTGTYRASRQARPVVVAGMPANTFDLGAWGRFLTTSAVSQKLTPDRLMRQIELLADDPRRPAWADPPDLVNRAIFRYLAVYLMRERLLMLRERLAFIPMATWGPGRVDTFNAPKALLNFRPDRLTPEERIGNADFPSIWHQGPRKGMELHWDGNNTSVDERNLSAAFGTGAYPPSIDTPRVLRTAKWLETAAPPPFPFPVDRALAARGEPLYRRYCEACHGTREPPFRGKLVGRVVPIAAIGTDRHRLDSYTWLLAANQGTLYAGYGDEQCIEQALAAGARGTQDKECGYPARFHHFRKTYGYANSPLDGIWLRAPYLHNGSVPTLWHLLEPAAARPAVFYRGDDVYDPADAGFVWNVAREGRRRFYRFDTREPGNGNQGHEGPEYGTHLPSGEKRALLEYLKTF